MKRLLLLLEKTPHWLRWILSFPIAILCWTVSFPIVTWINKITLFWYGESSFIDYGILWLASSISTGVFIWVGTIIVPKHHFITSIVYASIFALFMVFSIYAKIKLGAIASTGWVDLIIASISGVIAAIYIVKYFHEIKINV